MFKKIFAFFIFATAVAAPNAPYPAAPSADDQKIGVQNTILAKVNGTTISMMDVKKKMDLLFYRNYSNLRNSAQARFQFYENSWRPILKEMIDHELMLADAADKDVKLTDAEVRQEIENRFGPNVMQTLDQIGVGYDEAWTMIKNEMIVQQMNWWFIHKKARDIVTPQDIRQAFQKHLKENPATTEYDYRVLTVRGVELATLDEILKEIQEKSLLPEAIDPLLKQLQEQHSGAQCSLSTNYRLKEEELSDSHKTIVTALPISSWSAPIKQTSKDQKEVIRIFYLAQKIHHKAPSFEEMMPMIKNELLQKAAMKTSDEYLTKLRKHYRFDNKHLAASLPDEYQPFSIQ